MIISLYESNYQNSIEDMPSKSSCGWLYYILNINLESYAGPLKLEPQSD